jgi:excisionase family DNA binding protein
MARKNVAPETSIATTTPAVTGTLAPIALTIQGAAQYLSVAPRLIRTLVSSQELRPILLGKRYVFRVTDLQQFLDRKAKEAA